jgi:hypothetical protein
VFLLAGLLFCVWVLVITCGPLEPWLETLEPWHLTLWAYKQRVGEEVGAVVGQVTEDHRAGRSCRCHSGDMMGSWPDAPGTYSWAGQAQHRDYLDGHKQAAPACMGKQACPWHHACTRCNGLLLWSSLELMP